MEVKTETTEVQPKVEDHVSVDADGTIILSEEAEAVMDKGSEPIEKPLEKETVKETKEEKKPEEKQEVKKRKIKHNGEEVEIEPEKEEELLQKGFDYTKKTQALAAEREMLTPYVSLVKAMQEDPNLTKHIAGYLKGDTKKEEISDDPIEQLKNETIAAALAKVEEKYIKPLQQQTQNMTRAQQIDAVRLQVQQDPLYSEVQKSIVDYVKELPEIVAKNLYLQLDQDPKSYLETYNRQREKIVAKQKQKESEKTKEDDKLPEPEKRETHAPILESASKTVQEPSDKAMKEKIKELTRRSKNGDYQALGELLELRS